MDVNSCDVMMELENDGNYKFYKCRGLTRDTGGTVCDTSERYDDCVNVRTSLHYADESGQNDMSQFEPIVYFFSSENEYDKKESLVDSTTHLDDDEFNEYETYSNSSQAAETEVLRYFPGQRGANCVSSYEQSQIDDENFEPYSFSSTEVEQSSDNDVFRGAVNGDFDSYHQHDDSRDDYHLEDTNQMNNSYHDSSDEDILIIDDENHHQHIDPTNPYYPNDLDYDAVMNKAQHAPDDLEDERRPCHKRKQIYSVKEDLFSESPREGSPDALKVNFPTLENGRETSLMNNGKKFKTNLKWDENVPFPNVKMNSILKGNRGQVSQSVNNQYIQDGESFLPAKNQYLPLSHSSPKKNSSLTEKLALDHLPVSILKNNNSQSNYIDSGNSQNGCFSKKEFILNDGHSLYNYSSCSGRISIHSQNFVQYHSVSSITRSNYMFGQKLVPGCSEFDDDNYFNYVQPREIVVESDMDKLVSPTVDIDANTSMKTFKINQTPEEAKIDCNGNEVKDLASSKSEPSISETVEQHLSLRSAYAKKLGFENVFNTSNDCVIDEILFGEIILKSRLEADFSKSSVAHSLNDGSLKISCSILETLNDLQRCEEYVEKNNVSRNYSLLTTRETLTYKCKQFPPSFHSNLSFNFFNKSNSLGVDHQSKVTSIEENSGIQSMCTQSTTLKMKIKKENDEYRIDESKADNIRVNEKEVIPEPIKTIDGYLCYHCPEKLRTKKLLRKHVSDNHKVRCKKSSTIRSESSCPRIVTYRCDKCKKEYRYPASLKKHQTKHNTVISVLRT